MRRPWSRLGALASRGAATRERMTPKSSGMEPSQSLVLDRIQTMLQSCVTGSSLFPLTTVYNESWLLRLVVDWFSTYHVPQHLLTFPDHAWWFGGALLPTPFGADSKKNRPGDSWTHVDAAVGQFEVRNPAKPELVLLPNSTHLVVLEAKIRGGLSSGVPDAKYYDEVARTVASIAETLRRAKRRPAEFDRLVYCVLAPHVRIAEGTFSSEMNRNSIERKVKRRVEAYGGAKESWHKRWFSPVFKKTEIITLSWEQVIETIGKHDFSSASSLEDYYHRCLEVSEQSGEE